MKLKIGMRVLEQHASVVIKGAMQHAAELLLSNDSIHNKLNSCTWVMIRVQSWKWARMVKLRLGGEFGCGV
jgi:hypothetical protein